MNFLGSVLSGSHPPSGSHPFNFTLAVALKWVVPLKWVSPAQVGRVHFSMSSYIVHFVGIFWRPSRCPNQACDSSLEILWSLISNTSGIMQFRFHLPCQKSNLPTLVKMSRMRLPQGRALLQSTFEGLPQLQI